MNFKFYSKVLLAIVFFASLFFVATGVDGQSSKSLDVGVEVTGVCNFNGVCETGSGESATNCPDDCAGTGNSNSVILSVDNIRTFTAFNSAKILWYTTRGSFCDFYWGQTSEYENEIISETQAKTDHSVDLAGLRDSSLYHFKIACRDGSGFFADSNDKQFRTLSVLSNVVNFRVAAEDGRVVLSWENPKDGNFSGVLLLRSEKFYPLNTNDGKIVYEGTGNSFEDTGLTSGKTYYYTIFTKGLDGSYSSGAIVSVPIGEQKQVSFPLGKQSTVQQIGTSDFIFYTASKNIGLEDGNKIRIQQGNKITISIDCKKLSASKTVFVQSIGGQFPFAYILKPIGEQKNCAVSFYPPQNPGAYPFEIFAFNYNNEITQKIEFELDVSSVKHKFSFIGFLSSVYVYLFTLLIFFIILFLMLKYKNKRIFGRRSF